MELIFATLSLFSVTVIASLIYYKRIREAQAEYEDSKSIVRSITVGFTEQLKKLSGYINLLKRDISNAQFTASEALKVGYDTVEAIRNGEEETKKLAARIYEAEKTLTSLREEMNKRTKMQLSTPTQMDVEAPIPLKQEAVLDQLTQTELEVLSIIEEAGESSVPDIRKRIEKTREHTARLLKKLFEKGYIDRNTSRMPYRYYIRKEIRELIQQQRENMKITF